MQSIAILLFTITLPWSACLFANDDARVARSREITNALQTALTQRLQAAIAENGPVGAIDVCRIEAPLIAARVSADSGASVGRTALKVRNSANTPDAEAQRVLESFHARLQAGESVPPERFESRSDGSARYMRAIVLQPMCTVCHGTGILPSVAAAIAAKYPNDRATGFVPGELRGAFIVEWAAVPK